MPSLLPLGDANKKKKLIARLVRQSRKIRGAKNALDFECFIKQYYRDVPPRDIIENDCGSLFAAAWSHWRFGASRILGKAKIGVFNAHAKENGWVSAHTIIEIVTDDMPFLVDTITAELNRLSVPVRYIVHPIYNVRRALNHQRIETIAAEKQVAAANIESFIHAEVAKQSENRFDEIRSRLERVIDDLQAAVSDWAAMRHRLTGIIKGLNAEPVNKSLTDSREAKDFLSWILDNHFTLLGYREYSINGHGSLASVAIVKGSGLGVLRKPAYTVLKNLRNLASMPPEVLAFVNNPNLLMILKADEISTVHRPAPMDVIGIKQFNAKGKVSGLRLLCGLFTSTAYSLNPWEIPLLKRKLENAFKHSGFTKDRHDGKALLNILTTYPRDELFQATEEHLLQTSLGILFLQNRQRVALFIRRDEFERFVSCLIFTPRDDYTTALRLRFQEILEKTFAGQVTSHNAQLGETMLARLHVVVRTAPGKIPDYNAAEIEKQLIKAACSWLDRLREALIKSHGEEMGLALFRRYQKAFRLGYTERFTAETAVVDIAKAEEVLKSGALAVKLYRPEDAPKNLLWLKLYSLRQTMILSDVLPVLEHMGFRVVDEKPHSVRPYSAHHGEDLVMLHDFGLETKDGGSVNLDIIRENFKETFKRAWQGEIESDGFNVLAVRALLTWREVVVIRAYGKYLRQAGAAFSQPYMEQTLANHPRLARLIVDLFLARLDPDGAGTAAKHAKEITVKISKGLDAVASAGEDRVIRRFVNLVLSTIRTNYFQRTIDGSAKPYISFKLDSAKVDDLPLPRPMFEVFVYSPKVEAIHLRGGKVARGGIRWSDRREDFRTEILGLLKAQKVKNAVIVPVGSKGGFVVKQPPIGGGREAQVNEGIECYKTFMRGLLNLTDNLCAGKTVPPKDVLRHDEDDPYLVVAADKGTAAFSDIANGISAAYGFWLGDAFASGGSAGYDHKKMGITAKGAWISVMRHFRELGVDIGRQEISVIGVGDMSGDVFGNGMLLSRRIRLQAAFNHQHIFIDPDPDAETSFAERKRLFQMPRSSWIDYNPELISKGGGVFDRRAKIIVLTPAIKKRFAIVKDKVTPNELILAILRSPCDLLWFAGIGTYVKSREETNADAGDRANDQIRVNASELKCAVIGEGANMGMTQRSRIEYALAGGRLNTDFIDNSAGVDCSDNEVNIKILLDQTIASGRLALKQRNELLTRMTSEVADLVLRDNYLQTQAISVIEALGFDAFDDQSRLMRMLEKSGKLNRAVEFLPDDETLAERQAAKQGFVRPEIAVLMSYAKIWLYDELLKSNLPDDPVLTGDLANYFPTPLQKRFAREIGRHRLRREIIATRITNSMINRVGGAFVHHFMETSGMAPPDIARAYIVAREVLDLRGLWEEISALDGHVPAKTQINMLLEINNLLRWVTLWFLDHGLRPLDTGALCAEFASGFRSLIHGVDKALPRNYRTDLKKRAMTYIDQGVPKPLAHKAAGLVNLFSGGDVVRLAKQRQLPVAGVARLYFAVGARFKLGRLRAASEMLDAKGHWQKMAASSLVLEIYAHQLALTVQILDASGDVLDLEKAFGVWEKNNAPAIERTERLLAELWAPGISDISMIAVASNQLRFLSKAKSGQKG